MRRRHCPLAVSYALRSLPCRLRGAVDLALSLLDPALQLAESQVTAPSVEQLGYLLGPYDMRRLQSYARNLVDYHLVMDLVPMLASLRFTGRLTTPLSHVQAAVLLGIGLQRKSLDELSAEIGLPASQMLALFNKAVRKMVAAMRAVEEEADDASMPGPEAVAAAGSAMRPLKAAKLSAELDEGAAQSLRQMEKQQAAKQAAWLSEVDDGSELARYAIKGSETDWALALGNGGKPPAHVNVKSSGGEADSSSSRTKSKDGARKGSQEGQKRRMGGDGGKSAKLRKS